METSGGAMDGWIAVCKDGDLAPRQVRVVAGRDGPIAVVRGEDGRCYAVEDRCPHRGARLSAGTLYDRNKVACLDHGWSIRLVDGGVEPPGQGCARTFAVEIRDGEIMVRG